MSVPVVSHAANSLQHLARPPSRPGSAASQASRPGSAASTTSRRSRPGSAKTALQLKQSIDGDTGPPMIGVQRFAYARRERYYLEDFEPVVAGQITHPYTVVTAANEGSCPHNLIAGTAFMALKKNESEYKRAFVPKSSVDSANTKGVGLRSEQAAFIG